MASNTSDDTSLRFPIGRFQAPNAITAVERAAWIEQLASLPGDLKRSIAGLNDRQLDTPYRPGGWTVRQVVHHLPDSHLNSYTRFRLALTEVNPTIKPYDEGAWADLADARTAPVVPSLALLEGLHARWVILLKSLGEGEWARTFRHPEMGENRLDWTLGLYAWHSRHHVAHIDNLRKAQGW